MVYSVLEAGDHGVFCVRGGGHGVFCVRGGGP